MLKQLYPTSERPLMRAGIDFLPFFSALLTILAFIFPAQFGPMGQDEAKPVDQERPVHVDPVTGTRSPVVDPPL